MYDTPIYVRAKEVNNVTTHELIARDLSNSKYKLIGSDGHILDTTPREWDAVKNAARFPSVDPQSVLSSTEKTFAFRMKVDGSRKIYDVINKMMLKNRQQKTLFYCVLPDTTRFWFRIGDERKVLQVPKEDPSIGSTRSQQKFVRMEDNFVDSGRMFA